MAAFRKAVGALHAVEDERPLVLRQVAELKDSRLLGRDDPLVLNHGGDPLEPRLRALPGCLLEGTITRPLRI
jgi:hypothetical protein